MMTKTMINAFHRRILLEVSEEEVAYAIEQCSFLYISTPGVLEWIGKKVNKDY